MSFTNLTNVTNALPIGLIVISSLTTGAAFAAGDTFMNGNSIYGVPVQQAANAPIVNVNTAPKALNVRCGDTLTFVNGDKRFSWKFDVASHQRVDVAKIAPANFGPVSQLVYVSRNDLERGS